MLKAMFIRFYLVGYKTVLLRNVFGWPKTQMEMVSSPNDEEVASSKKTYRDQTGRNRYPFFRPKRLKKHTLWRRTHLYRLYKGIPPSRDAITLHLCKVFHRTTVLLIVTTTVLTNKRHMSRSICTEKFENFSNFLQRPNSIFCRSANRFSFCRCLLCRN